ncbi:DEAD/DEAH box helicase [Burkholderia perseverans]|uniref:DEAD/DEAH box helicase n=1 Tax=Burkholderia perseverans TaxID=2615214 RepID=UPI001FF00C63|nr:ATP-binding protein [Burkholderia perseverans]
MTEERPYFDRSIVELEALFVAAQADDKLKRLLRDELNHRSTARAAALLQRIESSLQNRETSDRGLNEGENPDERAASKGNSSRAGWTQREDFDSRAERVQVSSKISGHRLERSNDEPAAILTSWIAMEALSPQTYRRPADLASGDQRCVVALDQESLPWVKGERSRPKYQLFYQIVLGSVVMDRATQRLVETFGENEERSARDREKAAIAAVLVDRNGILLEDKSVAVSSFAWALPVALDSEFARMGQWTDIESRLVESLTRRLRRVDAEGRPMPLTWQMMNEAYQWLVDGLKLPQDLIEPPSFALRVYHHFKARSSPEVDLLNSFYLTDLGRAAKLVGSGQSGEVLSRFLGLRAVVKGPDLLSDRPALEALLAPAAIPAAKWPAPGGFPLVTLQQAAVNGIRSTLRGASDGIVAVNGPPGTGKTTLLRDIVAGCVLDRAMAMVAFDDPVAAFSPSGQKIAAGERAFFNLYRVAESLRGHEVVVASSNNKAVENVSKELPSRKTVGTDLRYLRTVSDRLQASRSDDGEFIEGEPTWGLVAAVLGNATNRGLFQQAIWWDDDKSLRLYLKAARGDQVFREIRDDDGNVVSRVVPTIVVEEHPPTPEVARKQWQKVRHSFSTLHASVLKELAELESVRRLCLELTAARKKAAAVRAAWEIATSVDLDCQQTVAQKKVALQSAESALADLEQARVAFFSQRPNFFARILKTQRYQKWLSNYRPIEESKDAASEALVDATREHRAAFDALNIASTALLGATTRHREATTTVSTLEAQVTDQRNRLGVSLVDDAFFEQSHDDWNLSSPWVPASLHRKREELFAIAMEVHQAFLNVAAQKISHNLGALMGAMQSGALKSDEKKALLPDLWATLFLVVPVVSTTFASVDRMLGDVPPASLGYLLIDEAGQATPQAAVGALMRTRKVIVVGDPLQIPPVVSLPERLVMGICDYFRVSHAEWAAPQASVQTIADAASPYQAQFRGDVGNRQVGFPLLVHRRCQLPMFSISNKIAYDGQMVYAAGNATEGAIAKILGKSSWFDVNGTASSKWCPDEGRLVVALLEKLAAADVRQPDIYIISPFRLVAAELRRLLSERDDLFAQFGVDAKDWLKDRIGTIHTFQGKEAEAVIAVMGAPMAAQQGARRWAGETPNILNVMVSRAKNRMYVVGSRVAWERAGHCQDVASALPVRALHDKDGRADVARA